jgi:hypothetical protein
VNKIPTLSVIPLSNSGSILFVNIDILVLGIPSIREGPSRSVGQYTSHTEAKKDICLSFRCDAATVCGLENALRYLAFRGIMAREAEALKFLTQIFNYYREY